MKLSIDISEKIKKIVDDIIIAFPSIVVIYLFGSHAKGKEKEGSDVDLAVFTDGTETPTMDLELGLMIEQKLKMPVDVVIMQKVSPILQHEIISSKGRIYEKDPEKRAILEVKSFHEFNDAVHYQKKRTYWRKLSGKYSHCQTSAE